MTPAFQPSNPLKAIGLILVVVMLFAVSDVVTKHLTLLYTVPLIMLLRYLANLGLLLVVYLPREGRAVFATRRTGLVLLRAACLAVGSLTIGLALHRMPVAETMAIVYLAPVLVVVLGRTILGEEVNWIGWAGVLCGFAGVLLIIRPGAGLDPLGVALCLVNSVFGAGYHLLSRLLSKTETTASLLIHTAGLGALAFGLLVLIGGPGALPQGIDWVWLLALGVLTTGGHFLFTAAYRLAPASLLAPVNYMHLVWAGLLGWLVFDHAPDALSLSGMALVAAAGTAVALRSHFAAREPVEPEGL
jgi:drug/metabolite transporter (DMT)-like permease